MTEINNSFNPILHKSKNHSFYRVTISISLFVFIVVGFIAIGYWILSVFFLFILLFSFRKTPVKVLFYEDYFIVKYLFYSIKCSYQQLNNVTFHYSGPFTYPKLVLSWQNLIIGFEWGGDPKRLKEMLLFFQRKNITLLDPSSLLRNHLD